MRRLIITIIAASLFLGTSGAAFAANTGIAPGGVTVGAAPSAGNGIAPGGVTVGDPNAAAGGNGDFQFQPIVSIPLPTGGSVNAQTSLSCYLNAAFKIAITVSVVLAVIMIVIDGFKYMTAEAVGNKKDALGGIRSALFGLILLLASWLILNIINPQILSLSILSFSGQGVQSCGTSATVIPTQVVTGTDAGTGLGNAPDLSGTANWSSTGVSSTGQPYTVNASSQAACETQASLYLNGSGSFCTQTGTVNSFPGPSGPPGATSIPGS